MTNRKMDTSGIGIVDREADNLSISKTNKERNKKADEPDINTAEKHSNKKINNAGTSIVYKKVDNPNIIITNRGVNSPGLDIADTNRTDNSGINIRINNTHTSSKLDDRAIASNTICIYYFFLYKAFFGLFF